MLRIGLTISGDTYHGWPKPRTIVKHHADRLSSPKLATSKPWGQFADRLFTRE